MLHGKDCLDKAGYSRCCVCMSYVRFNRTNGAIAFLLCALSKRLGQGLDLNRIT